MSAEFTTNSTQNICEGCPKLRALLARRLELEQSISCSARSRIERIDQEITALNDTAGRIACSEQEKQLPSLGVTVPPFGEEWVAFGALCVAAKEGLKHAG
jgi:hypothetical protein